MIFEGSRLLYFPIKSAGTVVVPLYRSVDAKINSEMEILEMPSSILVFLLCFVYTWTNSVKQTFDIIAEMACFGPPIDDDISRI